MNFIRFSNLLVSLSTVGLRLKYSAYESGFIKEIVSSCSRLIQPMQLRNGM